PATARSGYGSPMESPAHRECPGMTRTRGNCPREPHLSPRIFRRSAPLLNDRDSWPGHLCLALDFGRDSVRIEAHRASRKPFVDDAPGKLAAAYDESLRHAMDHHIALFHREIDERLSPIDISQEDRGQLRARREREVRLYAIVRCRSRLQRRSAAIPVVAVLRALAARLIERGINLRSVSFFCARI